MQLQEYAEVFPESVQGSGEYIENDYNEILQIDTYNAQIINIAATQELINENEKLNEKAQKLENELSDLKAMIDKLFERDKVHSN